ncbi:MAG TPA: CRTAC1 family protein [Verrucomicrobiae bacterium]|nr:CRTAC1 family protein [Verrucomicrobiae bacterium]
MPRIISPSLALVVRLALLFVPFLAQADATFTAVTGPVASGSGATGGAWGDFNHDGFVDLFVSISPGSPSILYTNNGRGNFAIDTSAGVGAGTGSSWGSAWGDYDNDGYLDLLGSVYGGNNFLLHNNGAGVVTALTGAPMGAGSGNNVIWGDYDNDGFLDAFCAHSGGCLFHNDSHGGFTPVTNVIAAADVNGQGCSWGDYDNDGFLDLFVTRVNQANLLYHNNRDGSFTKITNAPFAADVSQSQGCSWGDYDNDGFLDLFVCNVGAKNFLYHNNGDGTFAKITNTALTSLNVNSSGSAWADYDNDGCLDLVIAVRGGFNLLFHNNGDGTFSRVLSSPVVAANGTWIGAAWGDFNNDGFPDLFVANQAGHNALYVNNGNSNNWLAVQCLGRVSNRAAIGAKVRLHAVIGGKPMWQLREISGGGGLASQNDLRAEFGLGDATNADVIRLEWPSGAVQEFHNVAARQFLVVKEPAKLSADADPSSRELHVTVRGGRGVAYSLETSSDLAAWQSAALVTNSTGLVIWTNPISSQPSAFFRAREQTAP